MALSGVELDFVRDFIRTRAAIVLDEKDYLIESRLSGLAQKEGFQDASRLVQSVRGGPAAARLSEKVIDALTTNETLFFRDVRPFQAMQELIVPEMLQKNSATNRLRIWSAACSTGQEPYSIAMMLRTQFPELQKWSIEIVGTDLSTVVLEKARAGIYNQTEVNRGLSAQMLVRYFENHNGEWRIDPSIRSMVRFARLNLIETWPPELPFDIVLLRNVMIYFDVATRKRILERVAARTSVGGYLLMGVAESPVGLSPDYTPVPVAGSVVFRRR